MCGRRSGYVCSVYCVSSQAPLFGCKSCCSSRCRKGVTHHLSTRTGLHSFYLNIASHHFPPTASSAWTCTSYDSLMRYLQATHGSRLHPVPQECDSTASESTADTFSPPSFFQHTDPPAQTQATSSAFQPPLQTTLPLGSSVPTAHNNSNDSVRAHASAAQSSANSSSRPHPAATTGNGSAMRGNVAAPSGVGYRVPPPSPLRPANLRPLPGPPRSGAYIAQQLASSAASSAGAVGQAADPTISTCALFGVATEDTVTNYDTASAATLIAPGAGASRQVLLECFSNLCCTKERERARVLNRQINNQVTREHVSPRRTSVPSQC